MTPDEHAALRSMRGAAAKLQVDADGFLAGYQQGFRDGVARSQALLKQEEQAFIDLMRKHAPAKPAAPPVVAPVSPSPPPPVVDKPSAPSRPRRAKNGG